MRVVIFCIFGVAAVGTSLAQSPPYQSASMPNYPAAHAEAYEGAYYSAGPAAHTAPSGYGCATPAVGCATPLGACGPAPCGHGYPCGHAGCCAPPCAPQVGMYAAPQATGDTAGENQSVGVRGLGIRVPEFRLELPTIQLPSLIRFRRDAEMLTDGARAPFVGGAQAAVYAQVAPGGNALVAPYAAAVPNAAPYAAGAEAHRGCDQGAESRSYSDSINSEQALRQQLVERDKQIQQLNQQLQRLEALEDCMRRCLNPPANNSFDPPPAPPGASLRIVPGTGYSATQVAPPQPGQVVVYEVPQPQAANSTAPVGYQQPPSGAPAELGYIPTPVPIESAPYPGADPRGYQAPRPVAAPTATEYKPQQPSRITGVRPVPQQAPYEPSR